jgi:hypothetical protein
MVYPYPSSLQSATERFNTNKSNVTIISKIGNIMAKAKSAITIDEEVDAEFRECVSLAYPDMKGNRKRCAEEAIKDWNAKIRTRSDKNAAGKV